MIRGKKYSACAEFANAINTGASIFNENAFCGGAPMSARSSSKICCCMTFQPVPPKRVGPHHAAPAVPVKNALPAHQVVFPDTLAQAHPAADVGGQLGLEKGAH